VEDSVKYEQLLKVLSNRLKSKRKELKLTQKEVAYSIGMEEQNYRRIENGLTNPTLLTLSKVAEALKCEVPELLK
tara:strand:- start:278 stop:502 length:225 start_codon:yes stop_codon:yes gene_type:complete